MTHPLELPDNSNTSIIIDAMVVVQEQVVFKEQINYCDDLGNRFVTALQHKINGYKIGYVVFDDFSVKTSSKDLTRKRRSGGKSSAKGYKAEDGTSVPF